MKATHIQLSEKISVSIVLQYLLILCEAQKG